MAESENLQLSGNVAFTHPDFVRYLLARVFIILALEMQSVAVGWQVYDITRRPLDLGLVGLAEFLPGVFLFLAAGHVADRVDRRTLLAWCYGGVAVCSALLLSIAWKSAHSVYPIYLVLLLLGSFRSFYGPAAQALLPQLVPQEHFPNAVAWSASTRTTATIAGPALGGLIYALSRGPSAVYMTSMTTALVAGLFMLRVAPRKQIHSQEPASWSTLLAGLRYIWENKLILGAVSLDLFAVLLGGAEALLPVYAREILHTGPWGLGLLRSAPGVGAAAMAAIVAHHPLRRRAGLTMLWCVAGFGIFTIVFGLSHSLPLSLLALLLAGAVDMVSVIIRNTMVQLATKDEMRGRVSAVYMLFIGASNELGQFESGVTAAWFGTVPAVVLGGVGTLLVIAIWAWRFPELRKVDRLTDFSNESADKANAIS